MKISTTIKENITTTITYLYILLFVYAATSKLLDFKNFQVQLGQSPLLSAFAGWVAWTIPTIEILIALMLMTSRMRLIALMASYGLMTMFSTYIFIIANYSDFVPCSCGGILEKMTWNEHLVFNLSFCFLAVIAIKFSFQDLPNNNYFRNPIKILLLFLTINFIAISLVVVLFQKSEKIIHEENNFIRRFPPHTYDKYAELDLKYQGYYFAGSSNGIIYLGNYGSPLSMLAVDNKLKPMGNYRIQLDNYELPFKSAQVRVIDNWFILTDGTVPCIFKGKIDNWKAFVVQNINTHFSTIELIDSLAIVFRGKDPKTRQSIIGTMSLNGISEVKYGKELLQKQIDGIFDSDGMLYYNNDLQRIIYLYYYRNQFIIADKNSALISRGKTIDTISFAKIKIAKFNNGDTKLSSPPFVVNKYSATFGKYLFVNSNLRGRFESEIQWKNTSVIDVYNLLNNEYVYSLPIYPKNKKRLHAMFALENRLYFIIDNTLVAYQFMEENQPRH